MHVIDATSSFSIVCKAGNISKYQLRIIQSYQIPSFSGTQILGFIRHPQSSVFGFDDLPDIVSQKQMLAGLGEALSFNVRPSPEM